MPSELLERVIEASAYANAKRIVDTTSSEHLPKGELIDMVHVIEADLVAAAIRKFRDG